MYQVVKQVCSVIIHNEIGIVKPRGGSYDSINSSNGVDNMSSNRLIANPINTSYIMATISNYSKETQL